MNPPKSYKDKRPWGEELWLVDGVNMPSMVKIISVKPGEALSLQYHTERDEHWFVISGNGTATIDSASVPLAAGSSCFISRGSSHRVTGGTETLTFVELAYGDFDEHDIVRLEDRYGRS